MTLLKNAPRYVVHKEAKALKILAVEFLHPDEKEQGEGGKDFALLHFEEGEYGALSINYKFYTNQKPKEGDYFVVQHGYPPVCMSWEKFTNEFMPPEPSKADREVSGGGKYSKAFSDDTSDSTLWKITQDPAKLDVLSRTHTDPLVRYLALTLINEKWKRGGESEEVKPIATLHDDGYWTWNGPAPYESNFAGRKLDVYSVQVPQKADEMVHVDGEIGAVPKWLLDAARRIQVYMDNLGQGDWAIEGIQKRQFEDSKANSKCCRCEVLEKSQAMLVYMLREGRPRWEIETQICKNIEALSKLRKG